MQKAFKWSAEKSGELKRNRGVSFEEVTFHISRGNVLDILEHPNQQKYPGQKLFVVRVADYAYLVPFVETEAEYFLKTIIPSRTATRKYLLGKGDK